MVLYFCGKYYIFGIGLPSACRWHAGDFVVWIFEFLRNRRIISTFTSFFIAANHIITRHCRHLIMPLFCQLQVSNCCNILDIPTLNVEVLAKTLGQHWDSYSSRLILYNIMIRATVITLMYRKKQNNNIRIYKAIIQILPLQCTEMVTTAAPKYIWFKYIYDSSISLHTNWNWLHSNQI